MIKLSIFLVTAFFGLSSPELKEEETCDDITVELKVKQLNEPSSKITLDVRNAKKPLKYIFLTESKELVNDKFDSNSIILNQKGIFYYAVLDANGCKVTSQFNVE